MGNIKWQAHRGGAYENPQNTIASANYGWDMGAIVEVDVRTTKDKKIICLHNSTLEETTNAPSDINKIDINQLDYTVIRQCDAGIKFSDKFKNEYVPLLEELFSIMQKDQTKELYLDLKQVDLKQLAELITQYKVEKQCIFCHDNVDNCIEIKKYVDIRAMLWIGGSKEEIMRKFEEIKSNNYHGINQIQLHLNTRDTFDEWIYDLSSEFIKYALEETAKASINLELFPWKMNKQNIFKMIDMGIVWFATDYPKNFKNILEEYYSLTEESAK